MTHLPPADATLPQKVVVSSFPNAKALPLWLGIEAGFFARAGLDLTLDLTPGSTRQRAALLRGDIHIAQAAVDNALQLIGDGHDVVIVMGGEAGMNEFIVQRDVRSFADFAGRNLVVDAIDAGYALQARQLLARAGLRMGVDYNVCCVGNAGLRLQSLLGDPANAGAILNPPFSAQARLHGLHSLGSLTTLLGPYQAGGGFVRRDWAQRNAAQIEAYITGYVEALRWLRQASNRRDATALLQRRLALTPELAAATLDELLDPHSGFATDAKLDAVGLANVLSTRTQAGESHRRLRDAGGFVDESFYERAMLALNQP